MELFGMEIQKRQDAYQLLALALRESRGLTRMPELDRRPGGKPYFPHEEGLEFNLSHSGHLALCALDNAPVGADIQMVREWRPGLPARDCGPEELAWLEGQPDWWRSFSLLWSLKESRVKESGQGLRGTIRSIRVPMMGEGETRQMDGLWFRTYGGAGWVAAVCGEAQPPVKICWWRRLENEK